MTVRVAVSPELLVWAQNRSGKSEYELESQFSSLGEWIAERKEPTLKQLEKFANATFTPVGYFFLHEPPQELLPIPDFRTIQSKSLEHASPHLLDTVYQCQQRQEWYRDYARINQEPTVPFIGSLSTKVAVAEAASLMREILSFTREKRGKTWSEAFRLLVDNAEHLGVLVMVNGVVGSNTHRKLDPGEFRGFAISDELAPLIFVNGADSKAAQIFTLAHELAHLWLGQSAVSDSDISHMPNNNTEKWCNQVAAEFLVPAEELQNVELSQNDITDQLDNLARKFKVSTLVILRRLYDANFLSNAEFQTAYSREEERIRTFLAARGGSGGSFYITQPVRTSRRFTSALIASTLEGQTLYRDAFQMLGFKKVSTFKELAHRFGYL